MAQTQGYTCDVCQTFATGVKASNGTFGPPAGWLSLKVRGEREAVAGEPLKDNALDICSNLCLARLGAARYGVEVGDDGAFGKLARQEYQRQWNQRRRKPSPAAIAKDKS